MIFLLVASLALGLVTILGFLARLGWPFQLFSHFRIQYVLGGALLSVVSILVGAWVAALLSFVAMGLNVWASWRSWWPHEDAANQEDATGDDDHPLTFVTANLFRREEALTKIAAWVHQQDAGLILLTEVPWEMEDQIPELFPHHTHRTKSLGTKRADVLLLSRHPFRETEIIPGAYPHYRSFIRVAIKWPGKADTGPGPKLRL